MHNDGCFLGRGGLEKKQTKLDYYSSLLHLENEFLNHKISILQDGLNGKESYTGVCRRITSDGIYTEILANYKYELHFIRHEFVISILRYNERTHPIY